MNENEEQIDTKAPIELSSLDFHPAWSPGEGTCCESLRTALVIESRAGEFLQLSLQDMGDCTLLVERTYDEPFLWRPGGSLSLARRLSDNHQLRFSAFGVPRSISLQILDVHLSAGELDALYRAILDEGVEWVQFLPEKPASEGPPN